jgi:hypothetical protein
MGEGYLMNNLARRNYKVMGTDILTGLDFLEDPPLVSFNAIVTNPPYSLKFKFIERCYELRKPFALLMPVETLGCLNAQIPFREYGIEIILFLRRINFKMPMKGWEGSGAQFPVAWFTWGLDLPEQINYFDNPIESRRLAGAQLELVA